MSSSESWSEDSDLSDIFNHSTDEETDLDTSDEELSLIHISEPTRPY